MIRIYILRKHQYYRGDLLKAFEIVGTFATRAACVTAANEKNKRVIYYKYTVSVVNLKDKS